MAKRWETSPISRKMFISLKLRLFPNVTRRGLKSDIAPNPPSRWAAKTLPRGTTAQPLTQLTPLPKHTTDIPYRRQKYSAEFVSFKFRSVHRRPIFLIFHFRSSYYSTLRVPGVSYSNKYLIPRLTWYWHSFTMMLLCYNLKNLRDRSRPWDITSSILVKCSYVLKNTSTYFQHSFGRPFPYVRLNFHLGIVRIMP